MDVYFLLRNRLIHGYDQVDFNILWDVLQFDLPGLTPELEKFSWASQTDERQRMNMGDKIDTKARIARRSIAIASTIC